ncbi:MAG: hypothetical protein EOP83_15155 [Verrucomicrobiaceae bacterium]|nr:MAG: hypothetical protein EOP83_15155 [Verrucomicrobiaceae bacterium]
MKSLSPFRSLAVAMLVTTTSIMGAGEKQFSAVIRPDPGTQTTSVRVLIPKDAHTEPVQSVYLQRASKAGLDLLVPVSFTERPDGISIFMMLPSGWTEKAVLKVTHRAAETEGRGSGVPAGETYEIPLTPPAEPKK